MENSTPIQKTKVFRVKVDLEKGQLFEEQCQNENSNVNAKLKEFIESYLKEQKKFFLAGKNKIEYNKMKNSFEWSAELDLGKKITLLENLSLEFLMNLKEEIVSTVQERNEWVHHRNPSSIAIPSELLGGTK